jgi:hypothetical protein
MIIEKVSATLASTAMFRLPEQAVPKEHTARQTKRLTKFVASLISDNDTFFEIALLAHDSMCVFGALEGKLYENHVDRRQRDPTELGSDAVETLVH